MNDPKSGRIVLALADGSYVRAQPHNDDASKVVLKATNGDILDNFAMAAGVDLQPEPVKQGSHYAVLVVDKEALVLGLANFVRAMVPPVATPIADPTADDADDDGSIDDNKDDSSEGSAESDATDNG